MSSVPEMEHPRLWINQVPILAAGETMATAAVGVLADPVITWGSGAITDAPEAATLSVTLRYRDSVDTLKVAQGDLVEVKQTHVDGPRAPFSGRVRNMDAELDQRGRLLLHITATDHLADLDNTYVSTEWHSDGTEQAAGMTVRERLLARLRDAGWAYTGLERLPAELGPSVATFYQSVKLTTLLRRYLAQWGPQATFYDASYTDSDHGNLVRRLAFTYMADTAPGDTLHTTTDGTWTLDHGEPVPLQELYVPAANVHRDVGWTSSPENLLTTAQVSRQVTRWEQYEDGTAGYVTSLSEVNVNRSAAMVEQYGSRTIEVETLTGAAAQAELHRTIGRKWMDFNGDEWRPGTLRLRDTTTLDPQLLSDLIGKTSRPRQWLVVPGVQVETPRGAKADLRGVITGGTLAWNHRRRQWDVSLSLSDTQATASLNMTFTALAALTDTRYSHARADQAGAVQFSSFNTISTLEGTTP